MTNTDDINSSNVLLQFLLEKEHITQEQADAILEFAKKNGISTSTAISESGIAGDPETVISFIAEASGYEYIHLDQIEISREALNLIDQQRAAQLLAVP